MRITRTISTFAIAGVAALGLVACGGDDDTDAGAESETTAPAETEEPADPETTEPETEPTSDPDAEPTDDTTDAPTGDPTEEPTGDNAAYCDAIQAAGEDLEGLQGLSDPTSIDADSAQQTADAFNDIAEVAPANVQDGWSAMADVFTAIAEADGDPSQLDPNAFDQTAISEAAEAIPQSVQDECGTTLGVR